MLPVISDICFILKVDDDVDEELYPYLNDVTQFIHRADLEGFRTVVHCVAGASRSTTLVLGKSQSYTLLI